MIITDLFEQQEEINYQPVVSSWVAAIGFDEEEGDLYVTTLRGNEYVYYDFPEQEFNRFLLAPSKGKFMWRNVMSFYDYDRLN